MSAAYLTHRRVKRLSEQLVFVRTAVWDESRGVHILHGARRAKPPTTEQIAVHQRLQELRAGAAAGFREPLVHWTCETWAQRLVRVRNRLAARAKARGGVARLEGLSS